MLIPHITEGLSSSPNVHMTLIIPSVGKTKQSNNVRTKRAIHIDGPEDKDAQAIFHFKYRSHGEFEFLHHDPLLILSLQKC
jgi:hypothetical protein